jgi:alkylhydroperoxidase family enzyme
MSWINEGDVDDKREQLLKEMREKYDMEPNVLTVLGLSPDLMESVMQIGGTVLQGEGPLERKHREMIAVRVSSLNECEY